MRSAYKLIFERSLPGRKGYDLPKLDVPAKANIVPASYLKTEPVKLPELAEVDMVRHFIGLSRRNYGVDNGFYPLGSCTMKYNPKINEEVATLFENLHPYADASCTRGAVDVMLKINEALSKITGFPAFTLQPAAGAHGEYTGLTLIKAYHDNRKDFDRTVIVVPDAAHGTNPASAALAGFKIREIASAPDGGVDLDALRAAMGPDVAGLMLTNPNTLGIFDHNILEITKIVHDAGGLCYYDGANFNAVMGVARPGDMGFDALHLNVHKTFSTPHGGGGPGCGAVGCTAELAQFLPVPVVVRDGDHGRLEYDRPLSVGKVKAFYGNFAVLVKTLAYIESLGGAGITEGAQNAVLNANYVMGMLRGVYDIPHDRICMHECVVTPTEAMIEKGVHTSDIAKGLIDYGVHPPTIYFPLIVHEAMMIEPTETESRETLDAFVTAMKEIAQTALADPEAMHKMPLTTPVGRPDEVAAARNPIVKHQW
ncbi:MAG: aminomethyl-transferring glycine dehydrogenase subunit GcvPB [Eubacteriales bacterium]|nr:aminomethyl-transferring glycine dehydrogenase subunit GcvPB [Eubacteriales bacterium]